MRSKMLSFIIHYLSLSLYIYMYVCVCVCMCMRVYVYACVCVCVCVCLCDSRHLGDILPALLCMQAPIFGEGMPGSIVGFCHIKTDVCISRSPVHQNETDDFN